MHNEQKVTNRGNNVPDGSHAIEPLLTYQQVGELLGVTDRTVWELVRKGELQNVRVGRSVRVDPVDLRAYIAFGKST